MMTLIVSVGTFFLGYGLCASIHFYRSFIRQMGQLSVEHTIRFHASAGGWDELIETLEEQSVQRAIEELIDESK